MEKTNLSFQGIRPQWCHNIYTSITLDTLQFSLHLLSASTLPPQLKNISNPLLPTAILQHHVSTIHSLLAGSNRLFLLLLGRTSSRCAANTTAILLRCQCRRQLESNHNICPSNSHPNNRQYSHGSWNDFRRDSQRRQCNRNSLHNRCSHTNSHCAAPTNDTIRLPTNQLKLDFELLIFNLGQSCKLSFKSDILRAMRGNTRSCWRRSSLEARL